MRLDTDDKFVYILFRKYSPHNIPGLWRLIFFFTSGPKREYGHVDLVMSYGDEQTAIVMAAPWGINIDLLPLSLDSYLNKAEKTEDSKACVEIKSIRALDNFLPRGAITCVSVIKALLRIRGFFVITPYQLYKRLKKLGGVVLWEH